MTGVQKRCVLAGISFLLLLGMTTIYSCIVAWHSLPIVELVAPQEFENGYVLPAQAVWKDANDRSYIVQVYEQGGAWGKEYVCVIQYVAVLSLNGDEVLLPEVTGLDCPVAVSSNLSIKDGALVRLSEGR